MPEGPGAETRPAMRIITAPGVFRPISDSWMLADHVASHSSPGTRVLDLCTGSGVVGLAGATRGADVTVVDLSRRALASAYLNARLRGCSVRPRRGHLFDAVPGETFDVISANPPYVPSPSPELPDRGASRAWEAGQDGRVVLDEVCDEACAHLSPGGLVLLVHSSLNRVEHTIERLETNGLVRARVVERRHGPLGPLMAEQRAQGRIPAGTVSEDLVVIRADKPG